MGQLTFQATLGGSVNLVGPNTASNATFTLPSADGSANQPLTTNGSGTLAFQTLPVAGGGTGAASLTANNVLLGNGTSALQTVAPGNSGNVLTSNGTTWASTVPGGSNVFTTMAVYTSSTTWTVPSGITKIKLHATGGGAGGYGGSASYGGDGGPSGGTAIGYFSVTPGVSYTITIGAGGAGGTGGNRGSAGGNTTFVGTGISIAGNGADSSGSSSNGGTASGGNLNLNGSSQGCYSNPDVSFASGGSLGGHPSFWGGGGKGAPYNGTGQAALTYGAGGGGGPGGSTNRDGGAGAAGVIVIEY